MTLLRSLFVVTIAFCTVACGAVSSVDGGTTIDAASGQDSISSADAANSDALVVDDAGTPDAGQPDAGPICGNHDVETGEDCDPPDGFLCDLGCHWDKPADAIVFHFSGHVTAVTAPPITVSVGDGFTGYYVYGPVIDSNSLGDVGDYRYDSPGYGIMVVLNGTRYYTNQSSVDFLLEVVNRTQDNYLLRSYSNLDFPASDSGVDHIAWQLDDSTGTALTSDAMPITAPVLSNWSQSAGLSIRGPDFAWVINGVIDSVGQ